MKFALISFFISAQGFASVRLNVLPQDSAKPKVCFFTERNFEGQHFCVPIGAQEADLKPTGWNDRVRSIKITGRVFVTVYRDENYGGDSLSLQHTVASLSELPGNWDKQISGFIAYGPGGRKKVTNK